MALSNRINFRGGQTSLGKYLYKNGVDNVALTGGLSPSGYTFDTGYTVGGTVRMDSNSIYIAPQTSSVVIVGTTIPVNLANVNSIIYRYSVNGSVHQETLDVSSVNDSRYVWVALEDIKFISFGAPLTKNLVATQTPKYYTDSGSLEVSIISIELA